MERGVWRDIPQVSYEREDLTDVPPRRPRGLTRPLFATARSREITRPADRPEGLDPPTELDLPGELGKLDLPDERVPDLGPARLTVAAVGGGEVNVGGWITPARIVHATDSRNVVVGNDCTLEQTEHHHFDRVTVSLDGVLEDRRVRKALEGLVRHGVTWLGDMALRAALRRTLIERGKAPEELDLPLAAGHANITTRSGVVQVGDGSRLETETPIFVRETVLPGAELLFRNGGLRRAFVAALREPEPAGAEMGRFLKGMLTAAKCSDQLRLLDFAAESGVYNASVFGIFCFTQVSNAGAVLAGAGNTFGRGVEVDVQEFVGADIARVVAGLRRDFAPKVPLAGLLGVIERPVSPPKPWWDLRIPDKAKRPPPPPPGPPPGPLPGPGGLW